MIRGTTPTHTFTLPFDVSNVAKCKIIYSQDDVQVFCKRTEDCVLDGADVRVTLTQEDTFKFDCKKLVQIQVRVLTGGGNLITSDVMVTTVGKCLDDEVLV